MNKRVLVRVLDGATLVKSGGAFQSFRYALPVSGLIKREIQVFNTFAEADDADYAWYRELSGNEKLKMMLEIMAPAYEAAPRFERIYRVVEIPRG
jgi:hypothetical protein